ncbi:unnamed protein product, partial [Ranitomeya imitator]
MMSSDLSTLSLRKREEKKEYMADRHSGILDSREPPWRAQKYKVFISQTHGQALQRLPSSDCGVQVRGRDKVTIARPLPEQTQHRQQEDADSEESRAEQRQATRGSKNVKADALSRSFVPDSPGNSEPTGILRDGVILSAVFPDLRRALQEFQAGKPDRCPPERLFVPDSWTSRVISEVEPSDYPGVDMMVDGLHRIWSHVVDNLKLSQEKAQQFANRRRRVGPRLRVGDLVWLSSRFVPMKVSSPKFKPRFIGPYRILEILNPVSFRLDLPASFAIHNVFHRSLLRRYEVPVVPSLEPPAPVLVEGELEYVVEKILDSRVSRRKLQYLVKWKGYGQEDNSWVVASDVHADDLVRAFHRAHPGRPGGSREGSAPGTCYTHLSFPVPPLSAAVSSESSALTVQAEGGAHTNRVIAPSDLSVTAEYAEDEAATTVERGKIVTAAPQRFKVDILPVDDGTPRIITNLGLQWLEYMDGKASNYITKKELMTMDPDTDDKLLTYEILSGPTHGYLENKLKPGVLLTSFTQEDVNLGLICYILNEAKYMETMDNFKFLVKDSKPNVVSDNMFHIQWSLISFTHASYNVSEKAGTISVTVKRTGNLNQYAIVLCRTEQGTATSSSSVGSRPGQQDYVEYAGQ